MMMCCGIERLKKETIKMKETEWKMKQKQEHKHKIDGEMEKGMKKMKDRKAYGYWNGGTRHLECVGSPR